MWVEGFRDADSESIPSDIVRYPAPNPPEVSDIHLPQDMGKETPLVSVVTPVLDETEYLAEALETVGAQTHSGIELILVDSSESTWVKEVSERRGWIRRFEQKPRGVSEARNLGIRRSTGTYVALLDADDYWHPKKIQLQVAVAKNEDVDAVWTDSYRVDIRGDEPNVEYRAKRPPENGHDASLDVLRNGYAISTSSLLLRSSELPENPFNKAIEAHEDAVFAIEFFKDSTVARVPEPLTVRRVREGSLTSDSERMYRGRIQGLKYIADEYPELSDEALNKLSRKQYLRARSYLDSGQKWEARKKGYRSLRSDHTNYRAAALCLASYLPFGDGMAVSAFESWHKMISKLIFRRDSGVERKEVRISNTEGEGI